MAKFTFVTSRMVPLPMNDVDTDQIIPARFLKVTDKAGLGGNLFADWRYNPDGTPKDDFVLNQPEHQGAERPRRRCQPPRGTRCPCRLHRR